MHGFRNAIEGPILQVPGSSVRLDAQLDTLWAGVNVKFGRSRRSSPAPIVSATTDGPIAADDGNSFVIPPPSPPSPVSVPALAPASGGAMPSGLPPLPTAEMPGASASTPAAGGV